MVTESEVNYKVEHLEIESGGIASGIATEEWAGKYGSGYETLMAFGDEIERLLTTPLSELTEKDLSLEEWK